MNNKPLVIGSIILGIIFIILAGMYWFMAAGSLPTFMPGYEAGVTTIHIKHGLASLILALALFIFAWFKSAKKSTPSI